MTILLGVIIASLFSGTSVTEAQLDATSDRSTSSRAAKSDPRLVIETGGHRALITALLFTADGRELVSVSHDKTIRVWTVSVDGQHAALSRTIRGQIGDGPEGVLWAADLSPSDRRGQHAWLAVGGTLAGSGQAERYAARLHDYRSGTVVALLRGHTNIIIALSFSPDGRWLASAGKDKTIRLWDLDQLKAGTLQSASHVLTSHTGYIYDLDWSPQSDRLASASYDQTVGLWDTTQLSQGRIDLIGRLRGHRVQLRTVAFHPDGTKLVSGGKHGDIRQWRARDGQAQGVFAEAQHKVTALSFSPDGQLLLAGNLAPPKPDRITVFAYPKGKPQRVFKGHQNTVMATAFHPSGRWVASGGGERKEILLWEATTGKELSRLEGLGRTINAVAFSKDGNVISWGTTHRDRPTNERGKLEHRFDLTKLARLQGGLSRRQAVQAREQVGRLSLEVERGGDRNGDYRLHIRRKRRVVGTIERGAKDGYWHSAYTLTPDGKYVLSGGLNGVLRLYGLDGALVAQFVGHTGEIKAVAVSDDGRWALSGANDQTLKLWSLQEVLSSNARVAPLVLSLFPATNGEWIAWTPEGFFTASARGAELMGYSVNQGVTRVAQFVSSDQLYDRFYRPDLIYARLHGDTENLWQQPEAESEAKIVLEEGLPPEVKFVSPTTVTVVDQPEITVQAEIMDQGGGIGKVIWRLDGITIASESDAIRAVVVVPKTPTVPSASVRRVAKMLTLLPGEHVIQVTAYDRHNRVASAGELLKITFKPKQQPVAPPLPALHVLAVGINRYRDKSLWLKYAVSDGEALTSTLRSTAAPLFQDVLVTHLTDDQATFAGLETAFRELPERIATRDVFVFHVAGHGVTMSGRYYFLPQDFRYHNADSIRATAINQESLQRWLSKIPAQKSLVLLDTCESGSFAYSLATIRGMAAKTAIDKLARATGRATIVASTENQPALEGYKGHGIFTYVLLRAFSRADTAFGNRDGYIGLLELAHHISARVPELSMEVFGFEQVPQVHILGSDFPLAVVPDK